MVPLRQLAEEPFEAVSHEAGNGAILMAQTSQCGKKLRGAGLLRLESSGRWM